MTDQKNNLKDTLNLPKTEFPMRANLAQNEPQRLKFWDSINIYETRNEQTKDLPPFVFHDGPPYANGSIHVGHLLNKVLKDFVVRSRYTLGQHCPYVPGWDCHGLPIEHRVMIELLEKKKDKLNSVDDKTRRIIIRSECKKYAEKHIKSQGEQMKRLLTMADYKNPYLTMNPKFERRVLEVFSSLVKEGIVYRQLKPVHWSIANQTALAEAELEYKDKIDTSVFVNFKAVNSSEVAKKFSYDTNDAVHFTIWTTTPWSLPANLAIAVNTKFEYTLVKVKNTLTVMATELIEKIESSIDEKVERLATCKGTDLLGLDYAHPFCDRTGKVVEADYVTAEDGSGLVHTAPGHGIEDYQTGLREGLEVYCPVQADGTYDETVPDWIKGLSIWKANKVIIENLENSGLLLHQNEFSHSYPHDWRSKTPVIFRSTEQWFISVDNALKSKDKSLRDLALNAIENDINFVPDWGQNRLRGMLESRPDWCISRQRSWGLPIPAFRLENDEVFMSAASIEAIAEVFATEGSDAWFKKEAHDLLANYDPKNDPDAPEGLDITKLEKMYDIFDVWFESGSSWNAVLNERGLGYPADLYLEGSDQHRGWFHLSLLPSLGVNQISPFKSVLTHGFIVDKNGRKMSKSEGNALNVDDLLKQYGAEVCRWWVSSLAFENDIKADISYFAVASDAYRKIRNTLRFLHSNIFDLDVSDANKAERDKVLSEIEPTSINAFCLEKLTDLQNDVKAAFTEFKFKTASTLLYDFCNDTLSSLYCVAVKDRLYCDSKTSKARLEAQYTLWQTLDTLCHLLAPILPHTADEMFQILYNNKKETIHLNNMQAISYKASEKWATILEIRSDVLKALEESKANGIENTLDAGLTIGKEASTLTAFKNDLADLFSVSRVTITQNADELSIQDLREEPRCERSWKRDETVKEREDGVLLSDRDFDAVEQAKTLS
jgi:isoleucyl-tRNA synthetase